MHIYIYIYLLQALHAQHEHGDEGREEDGEDGHGEARGAASRRHRGEPVVGAGPAREDREEAAGVGHPHGAQGGEQHGVGGRAHEAPEPAGRSRRRRHGNGTLASRTRSGAAGKGRGRGGGERARRGGEELGFALLLRGFSSSRVRVVRPHVRIRALRCSASCTQYIVHGTLGRNLILIYLFILPDCFNWHCECDIWDHLSE